MSTLANSEDPDEMPYNVAFHQGLYCTVAKFHRKKYNTIIITVFAQACKYLSLEGFLEKSLKIKSALKSTGKSFKCLEKSLNSTIFCST